MESLEVFALRIFQFDLRKLPERSLIMIKTIYFPKIYRLNTGLRYLAIASVITMLWSCASSEPPPTREINSAEQAIEDAEQARVSEHALSELQEARVKLRAARDAVTAEQYENAKRLAMQSSIYAELAVAKSELQKAQEINDEMEKNIKILREEMNRNSGEQK